MALSRGRVSRPDHGGEYCAAVNPEWDTDLRRAIDAAVAATGPVAADLAARVREVLAELATGSIASGTDEIDDEFFGRALLFRQLLETDLRDVLDVQLPALS